MTERIAEESIETITGMKVIAETEIGTGLEKGNFPETPARIEIGVVQAIAGPGQEQEQVQIETE